MSSHDNAPVVGERVLPVADWQSQKASQTEAVNVGAWEQWWWWRRGEPESTCLRQSRRLFTGSS